MPDLSSMMLLINSLRLITATKIQLAAQFPSHLTTTMTLIVLTASHKRHLCIITILMRTLKPMKPNHIGYSMIQLNTVIEALLIKDKVT